MVNNSVFELLYPCNKGLGILVLDFDFFKKQLSNDFKGCNIYAFAFVMDLSF